MKWTGAVWKENGKYVAVMSAPCIEAAPSGEQHRVKGTGMTAAEAIAAAEAAADSLGNGSERTPVSYTNGMATPAVEVTP